MPQKELPSKSLKLEVLNNEYEINYPKTGQFIDIEARKVMYSKNQYDGIFASGTNESMVAKFLIDTIATFDVLIPKLKEDINAKSLFDLDMTQSIVLVECYLKQYYPWHKEWQEAINAATTKDDEEKDKE